MGRIALGLAVLAVATPVAAFDMPRLPQPVDGGPALVWVDQPDLAQLSNVAGDYGAPEGRAVVECVLSKKARPAQCVIVEEDPPGRNVGKMMIGLAALYKARNTDVSGQAVVGRRVRFGFGMGRAKQL